VTNDMIRTWAPDDFWHVAAVDPRAGTAHAWLVVARTLAAKGVPAADVVLDRVLPGLIRGILAQRRVDHRT
jgi:hypothetical protein